MPKHDESLMQLAREYNINYNTLWRRVNVQGMTLEEARTTPVLDKSEIMKERWQTPDSLLRKIHLKTYYALAPSGEQHTITNLNQWCKRMGWSRQSLQHRMKSGALYKGWTVYQALAPSQKATEVT